MIYSTITTWYKDGSLAFLPTALLKTSHTSIAAAMEHRATMDKWQPVTATQAVRFDNLGFMDVVTFMEVENEGE